MGGGGPDQGLAVCGRGVRVRSRARADELARATTGSSRASSRASMARRRRPSWWGRWPEWRSI
eukprot:7686653-Prorocentrum_lima.AAC.1